MVGHERPTCELRTENLLDECRNDWSDSHQEERRQEARGERGNSLHTRRPCRDLDSNPILATRIGTYSSEHKRKRCSGFR